MAKDLVLSQADLNEEGIKTQLTQNDLLEVIVEEKVKAIDDEIEGVQTKAKSFSQAINDATFNFVAEVFRKEVKRLKLPFTAEEIEERIQDRNISYEIKRSDSYENVKYVQTLNIYGSRRGRKTEEKLHMCSGESFYIIKEKVTIHFRLARTTEQKGYTEESVYRFSVEADTKKTDLAKLYAEIDAHNQMVKTVCTKYENVNLDKEAILKEIRTTFNKQLIIAGAPKLRQKVKDTFLIELQ